jgi:diguanylate cyclase (GGDEF)-like protein/PAS domain S-box-containing protein
LEATATNLIHEESIGGIVVNARDVTDRHLADEALRYQAELLGAVGQAVVGTDIDGTIRYWNPAAERLYGWSADEAVGRNILDVTPSSTSAEQAREIMELLAQGYSWSGEFLVQRRDGSRFQVLVTDSPVFDNDGNLNGIIGVSMDISERKTLEKQLEHQAFHDNLTGLPNRALLADRLQHALARKKRVGNNVGVLYLDLDNFKIVNDSLGHPVGDLLLIEAAQRICAQVRSGDTVARMSGDEFTVLLDDIPDFSSAEAIAERVLDALSKPFAFDDQVLFVSASIGISVSNGGDESEHDLLHHADTALYRAKREGKARVASYDPSMHQQASERLATERALHLAVQRDELRVYYQPIYDLMSGDIREVEALLRWKHPERGLLTPGAFMSVAEETGLILPMSSWLLGVACRDVAEWNAARESGSPIVLSANLSARQFRQPNLADEILAALCDSGFPPQLLKLEITESLMIEHVEDTVQTLTTLKEHGVQIALDDFGTGYSSLAYLQRFPIDGLKIDRAFVQGLGHDPRSQALVKAIIAAAQALQLRTTAEGVETEVQARQLLALGCELGQGYLFARPMAAEKVSNLLVQHSVPERPQLRVLAS